MINLVLKKPNEHFYFCAHHAEWNHGCGGNEVTDDLNEAAVFQAELKDGKLEIVNGPSVPEGEWEARAVQFSLK